MAGSFPNDNNTQIARSINQAITGAHPEYTYWFDAWKTIRHCILGEYEIKRQGQRYLPRMASQSQDDYDAYISRAYFYNMTHRTINGLVGTVFRKDPKVTGVSLKLEPILKKVTKDNSNIVLFAKEIAYEILAMGRFGVLIDMDTEGKKSPFLVGYITENIVDWSTTEIGGRFELSRVVLREVKLNPETGKRPTDNKTATYSADYRVLLLEDGVYKQYLFKDKTDIPTSTEVSEEVFIPKNLGKPFNFIPFVFFGPLTNSSGVEKSPVLDIALMNVSHYQSVAQLEHGRFYTALPVYHVKIENENDRKGSYTVGPSVVWEYTGDKPPGIAEYNGSGLSYLERALEGKEAHISAMGGRMLDVRSAAVAESDNLVKLKEKNEQSLLLNVTSTINFGMTQLLQWMSEWENLESKNITVELNQDFLFESFSAREFRALTLMYKEGVLPIDVIYANLRKAEVIPEYLTLEEFKKQLDDPKNFPNNPDVVAKKAGYSDAKTQLRDEQLEKQIESDETIEGMGNETALKIAKMKPVPSKINF
jgi:hypothetical protein